MRRIWDTNAPDPETPVARGQRAGRSRLQPPQGLRNLAATTPAPHAEHACRTRPLVERTLWFYSYIVESQDEVSAL